MTDPSKFDFMAMSDANVQMLEAVAGHRAAALNEGFSETASEQMAVQFHAMLMAACIANLGKP